MGSGAREQVDVYDLIWAVSLGKPIPWKHVEAEVARVRAVTRLEPSEVQVHDGGVREMRLGLIVRFEKP
jgi:hypothetical protein